jgi:hypothetical protein
MSPMRTLSKFRALSASRRRLAVRSLLTVAAVRIGLTVLPFARLQAAVRRSANRPLSPGSSAADSAEEFAWAVRAASRYVPRATCLVQALALELLLSRGGYAAKLRIGVAKENGDLKAHAWVETEGQRLLEDSEPTSFAALPAGWRS